MGSNSRLSPCLAARSEPRMQNDRTSVSFSQHCQLNCIARLMLIPDTRETVLPLQGSSIDRDDSVSWLQSGVLGRAPGHNTLHKLGAVSRKVFVVEAQFNQDPEAAKKNPHGGVKDTGSGKQQRQCDQQRPWWRPKDGHNSDITVSGLYFLEQETNLIVSMPQWKSLKTSSN